jgi:tetratricopeptide (TPR) repeat protein
MGHLWKAVVLCAAVMFASAAHAQSATDMKLCGDMSNSTAGIPACTRLIAAGKLGKSTYIALKARGIHFANRKDYDTAIADYNEVINLAPTAGHYYTRGNLWMLKLNYPRAAADYDQSIRLKPNDADVHYSHALAVGRGGDYAAAIISFDNTLKLNPACAICHTKKGICYEKLGDIARARESFRTAIATSERSVHSDNEEARTTARSALARLESAPSMPTAPSAAPVAAQIVPAPAPQVAPPPPVSVAALPAAPPSVTSVPYSPKVAAAIAGRRVALVIGNSQYRSVPALANPGRDAATIANSLRSVGFQKVTLATDLTRDRLIDALKNFAVEADGADWAMVYFAGHGIEVGGLNYILPVDARLASDRDVQFEAIALEQIMASTEGAKKLHLVMLDACRDNPFANSMKRTVASRSLGRGLAQIEPDAGTLVVFSAKHGQVAFDGDGGNSPFVSAFVKRIATPQIEIRKLFDLVRDDVMAATNRQQQPYSYGSVPGSEDFYFLANAQ